jgi:hypothetical protein
MIESYGFIVAKAVVALLEAKTLCFPLQLSPGERQLSDAEIIRAIANGTHQMRQACIYCDMDGVLPQIDRLETWLSPRPSQSIPPRNALAQAISELVSRAQDELRQQFYFHLDQQDVRHYGQKAPFGEPVAKKFKQAVEDIERAGSCLALQQPTASVFHLMRAMEMAVRHLAKRMNVTITPQSTWRQMTGQMDHKIKAMPEATSRQKDKKNDWEEARANLHHVGSVWRNNTMHPATTYTRSQAHDVFNSVRVFMSSLTAV